MSKEVRDKTAVQQAKEEISPKYQAFYSAASENEQELEHRVRDLRDKIFTPEMRTFGGKRCFRDILKTTAELAEEGKYSFTQEDVTNYYSKQEREKRGRSLRKGDLFDPPVVLGDVIPPAQREKREEGLYRADYELHRSWELIKDVITSRKSPIKTMSRYAKAGEVFSDDQNRVIDKQDWLGDTKLESEEIDKKLAKAMAEKMDWDIDDLLEYHSRIVNKSSSTYLNKHDQHTIPSAQGGLTQRPISILSHWYEHMLAASDAGDALVILLQKKEHYKFNDEVALDKLIEWTFNAYQINSLAAELIRSAIPLGPNLSSRFIRKRRVEITKQGTEIIENFESIHPNTHGVTLTKKEKRDLRTLSDKIVQGRGSSEEDITQSEMTALSKLKIITELADRDYAVQTLKEALDDSRELEKGLEEHEIEEVDSLISSLKNGTEALYLYELTDDQHNALVHLQELIGRDFLIDIVVPERLHGIRPIWEARLDLDKPSDVIKVDPYGGSRLNLRKLLDVLEFPYFKNVFSTGGPPRREEFIKSDLENRPDLDNKVYGDLRYRDLVEGLIANGLIEKYYKSLGVEDRKEMLQLEFPQPENEEPPSVLQNVDKAADLVYKAILKEKKIATIGDCDQDGFFASINWRWLLEHMGVSDIDQKFNTRLEGHNVQTIDLLNLALTGNEVIIVNDTGSSVEDINTFKLIKNGVQKLEDIKFFREYIERISGFDDFSEHAQREIKKKLTQYINEHEDDGKINVQALRDIEFSTGRNVQIAPELKVKEYKRLQDFESFDRFLKGFDNLQIVVCDHHTASIEGVQYFQNSKDIVMVNPEWIREGYEQTFIKEMQEALNPEDGEIDVELVNSIQRKYICYPESDIVGTVTAGKVMRRLMELFNDEKVLSAETSPYYSLDKEERYEKYKEIAREILGISVDKTSEEDPSLSSINLELYDDAEVSLYIGDLWLERNSRKKIKARITNATKSLFARIGKLHDVASEKNIRPNKALDLILDSFQDDWKVTLNKKDIRSFILNHFVLEDVTKDWKNLDIVDCIINSAIKDVDTLYENKINQVVQNEQISLSNLRFYLDYAGELEKSFYAMNKEEKEEYIEERVYKLAKWIDKETEILAQGGIFKTNLKKHVEEVWESGDIISLRDLKKEYYNLIQRGYETHGGIPPRDFDGTIPAKRPKVRYEGNKVWKNVFATLEEKGIFSPVEIRNLQIFFDYGPYGLEFFDFVEAVATLGDGGSVGPNRGLENRWIVQRGMDNIEDFINRYWKADNVDKQQLKRIMPEIIRLVRISLRGTNIRSINWHQSRFLTHGISAFVNAAYRRAKEGRGERAKEFWGEMSDLLVRRSENEDIRRHRHTLPYAQEETIRIRENMLSEAILHLTTNEEELDHPILIYELTGEDFVDPVKGLRGLIAGELAGHFNKPVMVIVKEGGDRNKLYTTYSTSFRLPGKGNVASDMVQLKLAMNKQEQSDIEILGHGGHPQASGGTWRVSGKDSLAKLHEVLDPIYAEYEQVNPDAGIVDIEQVIEERIKELGEEGWEDIEEFSEYVDAFSIANTVASQAYNLLNPYGVGFSEFLLKLRDLKVVNISNGQKNDGDDYVSLIVRDKRGNQKAVRSFDNLERYKSVHIGDTIDIIVQPIARLRSLSAGSLIYSWPNPNDPEENITVSLVTGEKSKPHLDVRDIENIRRD